MSSMIKQRQKSMSKIALVTGANRGLGFEVVQQLAKAGITLILTARDGSKAEAAAQSLKAEQLDVHAMQADVSDTVSVSHLAEQVQNKFGQLDILVNNAAAYVDWRETVSSADLVTVHQLFETNLFGTWRIIQAFLPLLRQSA